MRYTLSLLAKRVLMIAVASWVSVAFAQTNLGAVLDVGGRQLSADEFKRDVVGKVMRGVGTIAGGATTSTTRSGTLELVYLSAGAIRGAAQGAGLGGAAAAGASFAIDGSWTIDERERVCTSIRMGAVVLAPRCQFWFVQGKQYFLSDSDSDRSARISSYTVQP
ncbi:MAG: hypothetical protein ABWZ19_11840 [Hyphomicrobium sp.]